jgi:hypothetical protein
MSAAVSLVRKLPWGRSHGPASVVVKNALNPPTRRVASFLGAQLSTFDGGVISPNLPSLLREAAEAITVAEERARGIEEAAQEAMHLADQRVAAAEQRADTAEMRARHIEEQLATSEGAAEHLKAEAVRKLTAAWNKVQTLEEQLRSAEEALDRVREAVLLHARF